LVSLKETSGEVEDLQTLQVLQLFCVPSALEG